MRLSFIAKAEHDGFGDTTKAPFGRKSLT